METLVYYSKNRKNPPFEVTIKIDDQLVYINCNCDLGAEKKICRHKINAIRGDKEKRASSTSDETIKRLKKLFGQRTFLRRHLEEKWKMLREYIREHPDNLEEIEKKRKTLGESFSNGFLNNSVPIDKESFNINAWDNNREIYANGLECQVTLKYENNDGELTERKVNVSEVFINNSQFYIYGYCHMREQERTFRIDRIQGIIFPEECPYYERNVLTDVIFKGNP